MLKKAIRYTLLVLAIVIIRFTYPILYQAFITDIIIDSKRQPLVIAHRGASGYAPENTLSAFSQALTLNVDIIEFDVHLTKDGGLIVTHDSKIARVTGQTGAVSDYTLSALQQMDAGSWFSEEFSDEKLPTLSEVLQLINGRANCIIELKWDADGYYPGLANKVVAEVEKINGESWCFVQSYEGRYLTEINKINPDIKLVKAMIGVWPGPLLGFYYDTEFHWGNYQAPAYLWGINVYYKTITKSQVADWHGKGLEVWTYTINDPSQLSKQVNIGVDGLITDYPDRLQNILRPNE